MCLSPHDPRFLGEPVPDHPEDGGSMAHSLLHGQYLPRILLPHQSYFGHCRHVLWRVATASRRRGSEVRSCGPSGTKRVFCGPCGILLMWNLCHFWWCGKFAHVEFVSFLSTWYLWHLKYFVAMWHSKILWHSKYFVALCSCGSCGVLLMWQLWHFAYKPFFYWHLFHFCSW